MAFSFAEERGADDISVSIPAPLQDTYVLYVYVYAYTYTCLCKSRDHSAQSDHSTKQSEASFIGTRMDRPMDNLTNELVGDVGSPESGEGKNESGEGEEQAFRNLCSHYSRGCSLVVSISKSVDLDINLPSTCRSLGGVE